MSFSVAQLDIVNAVLRAHTPELLSGNLYYVAYTTNTTDNDPDLMIALSSDPISTTDGFVFNFDADSYTLLSCYTSNYYSSGYYSGKRITANTVQSKILSVNIHEFVSTNVTGEAFCTLDYSDRGIYQNVRNMQTNIATTTLLCTVVLLCCLSHFFDLWQRRR